MKAWLVNQWDLFWAYVWNQICIHWDLFWVFIGHWLSIHWDLYTAYCDSTPEHAVIGGGGGMLLLFGTLGALKQWFLGAARVSSINRIAGTNLKHDVGTYASLEFMRDELKSLLKDSNR